MAMIFQYGSTHKGEMRASQCQAYLLAKLHQCQSLLNDETVIKLVEAHYHEY